MREAGERDRERDVKKDGGMREAVERDEKRDGGVRKDGGRDGERDGGVREGGERDEQRDRGMRVAVERDVHRVRGVRKNGERRSSRYWCKLWIGFMLVPDGEKLCCAQGVLENSCPKKHSDY